MLLTKEVEVNTSSFNIKRYEDLGYIIYKKYDKKGRLTTPRGTKIKVKVEDLPDSSHEKVKVECDYCGEIITKTYQSYKNGHKVIKKDACKKCNNLYKIKEVNKILYGVKNVFELDDIKDKIKQTNLERYGFEHHYSNPKMAEIYLNKENNPNWRGGVSNDIQIARGSVDYKKWREEVLQRDNYECQICHSSESLLHAHHIESFSRNIDLRYNIENGITLCINCHDASVYGSFHNTYGTINNTREQLEEYIEWYREDVDKIINA